MKNATRRVAAIALGATLMLAACSGSAAPSAPAAAGTAAATSAATTAAATPTPTTTTPSASPAADLSTLAGDWVASMEDVRLNHATGDYVGGVVTVDGGRIQLTQGGTSLYTGAAGRVGPTPIKNCKAKSCQVQVSEGIPSLITVLDDGTIAVVNIASLKQIDAGAGICAAPAVDGAGVVTITPDGNKISFVTGQAGGFGAGSGNDPCAGASYQIVWTQVLTRAP